MESESRALIGHTGFVGGNLARQIGFDGLFNSRNIQEIRGKSYSHMVISAAQAKKWWANQNPQQDWVAIERLVSDLSGCQADRVTLISTIDVLGSAIGLTEQDPPDKKKLTAYGFHRLKLEEAIRAQFRQVLVVRLPGLFGRDLKKNVIFDLLQENALEQINPRSTFQYYNLDNLWRDIEVAWAHALERVHLFPEPIQTAELLKKFFPHCNVGEQAAPEVHYDHRTIHGYYFGGDDNYVASKDTVLLQLGAFIQSQRSQSS